MGGSGIKKDAFQNWETGNNLSNQYSSQALGINSALAPTLTAESINPQGFNPTTMGQMTTAAEQTAGGSNAGAAGTAGLKAARTRNIGSGQAAAADAGRMASQNLSQTNAGIQSQNAKLKATQQQEGISGLGKLYGEDVTAGNNALGLSNQALDAADKAPQGFWQQYLLNAQKAAASMAAAGGA